VFESGKILTYGAWAAYFGLVPTTSFNHTLETEFQKTLDKYPSSHLNFDANALQECVSRFRTTSSNMRFDIEKYLESVLYHTFANSIISAMITLSVYDVHSTHAWKIIENMWNYRNGVNFRFETTLASDLLVLLFAGEQEMHKKWHTLTEGVIKRIWGQSDLKTIPERISILLTFFGYHQMKRRFKWKKKSR